ncbi:hypothetical protein BWI96_17545 [Siphonobacter sp. SORGH_AS_0500]|uniref:hypothetical protein n=1 Tax=Siphonobacter sp. SORGH_AS_0500 TaxID=1864824 RepID=UPI000CBF5234|nr:hypothetical protein [Siphonobacter sp. SORGH_AS_0500]PKK35333.1 hypothetical protein BWI96_17545 [Siphonobacter sp. SORGH_AS_0500]
MKKLILVFGLMAGAFLVQDSAAQVNVNVNLGSQPAWGPTGYSYAQSYYLPDIDVYYNIPQKQWTYQDGNRWVTAHTLPARYRAYDLYSGHKVVINEARPYLNHAKYRKQYAFYKGRHDQVAIRDGRDSKNRWDDRKDRKEDRHDSRKDRDRWEGNRRRG